MFLARQTKLYHQIKEEGFKSVSPYNHYICLNKVCVYLPSVSKRYSYYVSAGGHICYKMLETLYSNSEWRKLMKAQDTIKEEEEAALAKLLHLYK